MTREEAIECLSERVSIGGTGEQNCMVVFGVNTDTLDEAFDMAISALRQQDVADKDVGKWISVKDRLPETDGIYIVCDRRLNGYPWIHTVGFRKASSSWCELHGVYYDDGYGRYSDQDKFTHWMPMPEPPEKGTV